MAEKIIFTGGLGKGQKHTESSVAKKYALSKGIPKTISLVYETVFYTIGEVASVINKS